MQRLNRNARSTAWRQEKRAGQGLGGIPSAQGHFTALEQVVLVLRKHHKECQIGKLVLARPMNEIVLAMPYRNRQTVEHPSITPKGLAFCREKGATWWVVRFDLEDECWALPLDRVERTGWLKPSWGRMEHFVELNRFEPIPLQTWDYVTRTLDIDTLPAGLNRESEPEREPEGKQATLFEV